MATVLKAAEGEVGAKHKFRFISTATDKGNVYRATPFSKVGIVKGIGCTGVAELSAHDISIPNPPPGIADGTPLSIIAYLHPPLPRAATTNQSDLMRHVAGGYCVFVWRGHEVGVALNTCTMKQETQLATSIYIVMVGFSYLASMKRGAENRFMC